MLLIKRNIKKLTSISDRFKCWLTLFLLSPLSIFAAKKDPYAKGLGINFEEGKDVGESTGHFIINLLWYAGVATVAGALIVAVATMMNILHMSKEEKEHSGTMMKWIVVIVSVVIVMGIGGLLLSGLGTETTS